MATWSSSFFKCALPTCVVHLQSNKDKVVQQIQIHVVYDPTEQCEQAFSIKQETLI